MSGKKKLTVRKVDIAATAHARLRLLELGFSVRVMVVGSMGGAAHAQTWRCQLFSHVYESKLILYILFNICVLIDNQHAKRPVVTAAGRHTSAKLPLHDNASLSNKSGGLSNYSG